MCGGRDLILAHNCRADLCDDRLELARLKCLVSVEERQSMYIEIACIIVATVFELLLWDLRWIFDLGYSTTEDRSPLHKTLLLCVVQIACEAVVDVLATYRELKSGIPLLNIWTGRNKVWILKEMAQMSLAAVLICAIYHVVPYAPVFRVIILYFIVFSVRVCVSLS